MFTRTLAVAVLLIAFTGFARGASIEIDAVTTTFNGTTWDYAYSMILTENNSLSATNPNGTSLFVFYDLTGLASASFTGGTTPASDWNVIQENTTGEWAGGISRIVSQGGTAVENDSATAINVRFQYVGAGFSAGPTNSAIGTAHLISSAPPGLYGQYAARWVDANSNTQVNTQSPLMPVAPGGAGPNVIPLPSALGMGLSSLIGLLLLARLRRHA